jgi:hypothetical protein
LDRASTFADPLVIARLQRDFIPFAGDTSEFAWRRTEASRWFMQHGGKVNFKIRSADSVQGFYTLGADGTAYGFSNVRGAKTVNGLMTDAFNRFHANRPPKVSIVVDKPKQFANSPESAATDVVRVDLFRGFQRVGRAEHFAWLAGPLVDDVGHPAPGVHAAVAEVIARSGAVPALRVFVGERVHRDAELAVVILALGVAGRFAGDGQCRQQQRYQDADDRDDHQQFDQGKTTFLHTLQTP